MGDLVFCLVSFFIKSPKMKWETCCFVWFLIYQVTQNEMGDLLFCLVSYLSSHPKWNGRLVALFGFLFIKSPKMKWETCCFIWFLIYQVTQNKMGDLLLCLVSVLSSHPK
jgi:hypothetical protein